VVAKVPAEVGSTANKYQILGRIAVGGMAEIFLARGANATGMDRYCVLKRILRERASDAQFVQMFLDEARLAAQLQHPNIASVYDIGMLGDSYFFTMEYVHGETVRSLLERAGGQHRPIPLACVLTIIAGAAAGLHHAHERVSNEGRPLGIVHRDVSPSNLMVSYEGNVKIVDFGVAKAADREVQTKSGTVKGKISYLSPEQCRGARVDRRSDLFSLGIVMWEMLAGARLYRRTSDFDNMTAIVNEPPPRPSSRRAEVPRAIDDIVLRLLAKSVTDRFQTAGEVVDAIENASMRAGTILSTSAVSRLIRDLFGRRAEPWLELDTDTLPLQRPMLASMPLAQEIGRAPRDPVEAELAQVPDLSISRMFEEELGSGSSSSEVDTIEPEPEPAVPPRRLPSTPPIAVPSRPAPPLTAPLQPPPLSPARTIHPSSHPSSQGVGPGSAQPSAPASPASPQPAPPDAAAFGPSALLRSLAGLPRAPTSPASASTLLGVSAPGPAPATTVRPTSSVLAATPSTTVRDLSPAGAMAATAPDRGTQNAPPVAPALTPTLVASPISPAVPPAQVAPWPQPATPSAPFEALRHAGSAPSPAAAHERPSQPPQASAPPSFGRNSPAAGSALVPTTEWRRTGKKPSRLTPRLLVVMILAAAIGAVAAWLSMRSDQPPPTSHVDSAAAPPPLIDASAAPPTAPATPAAADPAPSSDNPGSAK
jgi:serine/threonine protein kinase